MRPSIYLFFYCFFLSSIQLLAQQKSIDSTPHKQESVSDLAQKMEGSLEKEQQYNMIELQQMYNRQKSINYIVGLACFFLLGIAGYMYRQYRNKRIAHELLIEQHAGVLDQKTDLQQIDSKKSQFFSPLLQELSTSLALIKKPIQQLILTEKENFNPRTIKELQLVQGHAEQLTGLVNDVTYLSKLGADEVQLSSEEVAIHPFLSTLISNVDSLGKQIDIEYQEAPDLSKDALILMDVDKVEKIITHLLSHVIKDRSSGGIITLSAHQKNNTLCIEVSDKGQGIAEENIAHTFERKVQKRQEHRGFYGSTGLGLALAKELTNVIGGQLSVSSQLGEGSRFTLLLPFRMVKAGKGQNKLDEQISLDHLQINTLATEEKRFNVLIVEDTPDMKDFVQFLLNKRYHTYTADHGKEALQVLEHQSIDLIVSDVMMPEMDGYTLLKRLKGQARFKNIPVIMLTALDSEDNKLKALTLGVDDYLSKPFSPEELLARTHNLLLRYEIRQQIQAETIVELEEEEKSKTTPTASPLIEDVSTLPADSEWVDRVQQIMLKEIENTSFNLSDLANQLHLSQRQFQRRMKQMTGLSPKKFQIEVALQFGRELLEKQAYGSVKAISYSAGMTNVWRFSQLYEARFGKKPSAYF